MTSASATGGKKRGRRRHQTVIEQSSGLDRVFIWDIDSSLVPGDMIGQSIEPSVLPSVADKLGNLSKKLREMTLSFCDQHMFLSEVESSDQMHIDDIPKDLEQAAPATATGLTSSPPANQQPASPATLQLYEQPANQQLPVIRQEHPGNGYPQDHYAEAPSTGAPTAAYADYQQQQQQQQQFHNHHNQLAADQQEIRQEHNSPLEIPYQVQKVEPPESSYIYPSNSSSSTLIEDISVSSAAAAAAAAAAAYAHSEPLWVEPIHQHHFQVPSTIHHHHPQQQQPQHHHHHHHQEAQYSFDQAQHQHIQHYQPAVHYHEQQQQQSTSEQNGLVYQTDFGQHQHHHQPPAVASAYPDYQHQFHHNHHHSQHQQAQEQQQQHHNHHQEQQGLLAGYQLGVVDPPETKYAYNSSCVAPLNAVADASGAPAAAYASEPLWVEPNNNHHFLTPAHHEPHYLFEQTSHHQLEPCQYQQPEQQQQQPEAGEQQQSSVEQNGNGNGNGNGYQQEFAAPNTTPAYQHDQYQQQPFGQQQAQETQHHHHNHNHHSHNHHHHIQSQNHNQQQQNEQQELLRPASNLNSKLQVIDSAFLNKPLKNVLSSHHSRLAYKLSVRYNRIKTIYNNFRFDLKAKDPKLHDELETILTEIDRYTLDWRKRSMDCLKLILESNNCTNLIVTKLPLVVALGHLICLNLGQYFDVDQIYSAIRTNSKEACIKRIKKRFGATNRCSYIIVGDREDVEMAKKLSLPSWITTRSDGHRQLLQLYTALKEGYLM